MPKAGPSGWQKAAWIVGFVVAAMVGGVIPKLTDLQTVKAAEAQQMSNREGRIALGLEIERVNQMSQRRHAEVMALLRQILKQMRLER